MFDRLYRVDIFHPGLTDGAKVIHGDSSRLSLNINFSSEIAASLACVEGGSITIYGLDTKDIDILALRPRDRVVDELAENYFLTLWIGSRENGEESELMPVLSGRVMQANPSAPPDRAITFVLGPGNVGANGYIRIHEEDEDVPYVGMSRYLQKCMEVINGDPYASWVFVKKRGFEDKRKITPNDIPSSGESFYRFLMSYGIPLGHSLAKSSDGKIIHYVVIGGKQEDSDEVVGSRIYQEELSETNGMIGLPRAVQEGAVVNRVMKVPTLPGGPYKINSTSIKHLSRHNYVARKIRYMGEFRGDLWQEELTLYQDTPTVGGRKEL